ncbi:MAG: type II toxin-antitoxin system HicB family antitoxin [Dehalococcoidia bacterium]|nr:type II toxin-antitoxin system HicB family antitoxin [Dehalococcoidia bacterium]
MKLQIDSEQEEDGRWVAEGMELPGVMAYSSSQEEATAKAQALALRGLTDRLDHGETSPILLNISFSAACTGGPATELGAYWRLC